MRGEASYTRVFQKGKETEKLPDIIFPCIGIKRERERESMG